MWKMIDRADNSKVLFWICNFCGLVWFYLFNIFTPLYADDRPYQYSFATGERINSIVDVCESMKSHWFVRGGRMIGHGLDQILLMYDKQLFNVINTVVFAVFILIIYRLINGKRISNIMLLFEYVVLWFFMPRGNVLLWQTVACNYFWGSVGIIILFGVYVRGYESSDTLGERKSTIVLKAVGLFCGGVLAGNFLEAGGAMLLLGMFLVLLLKKVEKRRCKVYEIIGFVGALIGYGILIVAPGNYTRAEDVREILGFDNLFVSLCYRIARETYYMVVHMWWLWLAFFVLMIVVKGNDRWKTFVERNVTAILFAMLSLVGVYVMTATEAYAERVLITPIFFLMVADGKLLVKIKNRMGQRIVACMCIFATCGMIVFSSAALYKCKQDGVILDIRKEYISNVNGPNLGK